MGGGGLSLQRLLHRLTLTSSHQQARLCAVVLGLVSSGILLAREELPSVMTPVLKINPNDQ